MQEHDWSIDEEMDDELTAMMDKGVDYDEAFKYVWEKHELAASLLERSKSTGLCAACESLKYLQPGGKIFHHSRGYLRRSASAGCALCQFFRQVTADGVGQDKTSASISIDYKSHKLYYKLTEGQEWMFDMFLPRDTTYENHLNTPYKGTQDMADSETCYMLAREWLQRCVESHPRCAQPDQTLPPTRLLDVTGSSRVFLVHSRNLPMRHPIYTALSYCWGGQNRLQTTELNGSRFETYGIPVTDLPKTLQDAVRVTRQLGLKYLWVDALCIFQDCKEDWEYECNRMGEYYRNAQVTLSALEATNANQGFLENRSKVLSALLFPDYQIRIRRSLSSASQVLNQAALSNRGWTLQERLLATRILHYSKYELLWECLTCSAREGSVEDHTEVIDSRSVVASAGQDFKRCLFTLDQDPFALTHGAFALWSRIVRQYAQRALTRSSDRLPAIAGIANMLERKTGSRYFAGLWELDIHGLAWCRDGPADPEQKKLSATAAPTWSWGSVYGPVAFRYYEEERADAENDAKLFRFPTRSSTVLSIRARARPAWCVVSKFYEGGTNPMTAPLSDEDVLGRVIDRAATMRYRGSFLYDVFDSEGLFGRASFDELDMTVTRHACVAAQICTRSYSRSRLVENEVLETPVKEPCVYFLLLVPLGAETNRWKRIGLGMTKGPDFTHRQIMDYSKAFENCEWQDFEIV